LLNKYRKLWVFGDSYTTPGFCVDPEKSFWGETAKYADISVIVNCSRPGNSFDSICHLLVTLSADIKWNEDLIIIGMPPLERITVFDDFKDSEYIGYEIDTVDWKQKTFDINSHRGLVSFSNYGNDTQLITLNDRSWTETQALKTVFFLTKWLESVDANYMIVNLSKVLDKDNIWGPTEFLLPYCLEHKNCILFDKTYQSINLNINKPEDYADHGWQGHHGPTGNKYFFDNSLLLKMKECNILC
jgi:hypothetical protein